jgi:hypothetical protein
VRSERIGGKVRQITLLNLGRHFPVEQGDWPVLCQRIDELTGSQIVLLPGSIQEFIEKVPQRYAARLLESVLRQADADSGVVSEPLQDIQEVDVDSLQLTKPRSVGVEHTGLNALSELGFIEKLTEFGVNGVMRAAILGNVIGCMARPASEWSTWKWLQAESGKRTGRTD